MPHVDNRRSIAAVLALAMTVSLLALPAGATSFNPFASQVVNTGLGDWPPYRPAPGQWVNNSQFNDPSRSLGAPSGGGTSMPDNTSVVSLGAFGGSLVLAFDHDVADSPANPMGLDAIVYTNAVWTWSDSQLHWGELAAIEIMPELNGSGVGGDYPGEQWYLIPGSMLSAQSSYMQKTWSRTGGTQPPNAYPNFAGWPSSYQTTGWRVDVQYQQINGTSGVLVNPNYEDMDESNDSAEGIWGYAEYTPTLRRGDRNANDLLGDVGDVPSMTSQVFYTTPDDPRTVGVSRGAAGGDAFDIAWAVNTTTWQPANLSSFRYIRMTTAVDFFEPALGEGSAEIDAVADVREACDLNGDGLSDMGDYRQFLAGVLLISEIDVMKVDLADCRPRRPLGLRQRWHQDAHQKRNDGHHYQQLDESEGAIARQLFRPLEALRAAPPPGADAPGYSLPALRTYADIHERLAIERLSCIVQSRHSSRKRSNRLFCEAN